MSDRTPRISSGGGVEPCAECGARLAPDQRYCLNCGRRRGEPRLDFRRHAPAARPPGDPASSSPPLAASPAPPPPERLQRDYAPLAAVGGIAVLGTMLLIGVLIGRGGTDAGAPAAPAVVQLQREGASGGDAGVTASQGPEENGDASGGGSKGKAKGGEKAVQAPPPQAVASEEELEALQNRGPQEYSEASAELPDEIATPGKAPPTDGRSPGAGSKGTVIE